MSDSYQAIYQAAKQQIGRVDTEAALREAFDISFQKQHLQQEIYAISHEMQRPSVLYRPTVEPDGNKWCALYGADLMSGVCGFGDTPEEAMADFDNNWRTQKTPTAVRMQNKQQ